MRRGGAFAALALFLLAPAAHAGGSLTEPIRIESRVLGYALQYRVYRPEGVAAAEPLPTLYATDGEWYLKDGGFKDRLDALIADGSIQPVMAVFVDARNPDRLSENRRTQEFMCNARYARFFADELVPAVETAFVAKRDRADRLIMGLSFGGLNAGCFAMMIPDVFGSAALQSPASGKHVAVLMDLYRKAPVRPVRLFLSVGTLKDNTAAVRRFRTLLEEKGYSLTYREVPYGHGWANWRPLIGDVLETFYGRK